MKTLIIAVAALVVFSMPARAENIFTDPPIFSYKTKGPAVTFVNDLYRVFGRDQGD